MEHPTVICALIGRNAGHGIGDINFAAILSAMKASADAGTTISARGVDGTTQDNDIATGTDIVRASTDGGSDARTISTTNSRDVTALDDNVATLLESLGIGIFNIASADARTAILFGGDDGAGRQRARTLYGERLALVGKRRQVYNVLHGSGGRLGRDTLYTMLASIADRDSLPISRRGGADSPALSIAIVVEADLVCCLRPSARHYR